VLTRLASYMRLRLLTNSHGDGCARRAPSCGWKALLPACMKRCAGGPGLIFLSVKLLGTWG
jgi:hypothetical protein